MAVGCVLRASYPRCIMRIRLRNLACAALPNDQNARAGKLQCVIFGPSDLLPYPLLRYCLVPNYAETPCNIRVKTPTSQRRSPGPESAGWCCLIIGGFATGHRSPRRENGSRCAPALCCNRRFLKLLARLVGRRGHGLPPKNWMESRCHMARLPGRQLEAWIRTAQERPKTHEL